MLALSASSSTNFVTGTKTTWPLLHVCSGAFHTGDVCCFVSVRVYISFKAVFCFCFFYFRAVE